MTRRVVVADGAWIYCDDGSVYRFRYNDTERGEWLEVAPVPGSEREEQQLGPSAKGPE